MAEGDEKNALKEGEIAVAEKDFEKIKAKAAHMDEWKAKATEREEKLSDLQEEVEGLREAAQKGKEGGDDTGGADIAAAVAEEVKKVRRDLEKAHEKALAGQELKFAARLALVESLGHDDFIGSIDLADATDTDAVKERVKAFVEKHPELKGANGEPKEQGQTPPVTTGPGGSPPPGNQAPDLSKLSPVEKERELAKHFASRGFAIQRGSGEPPKTPG